jgi:undecaprenyl-diphosphatase
MNYFEAIIIAIIEGLTEYLPVSSTGLMILTTSFLGIKSDDFIKFFIVNIQLGAILAVVVLYFKQFFKSFDFYFKLIVAFIPAAVFGILLSDKIDELLESPATVAISLLLGGIVLLFVDQWFSNNDSQDSHETKEVSYLSAFIIGCFQCISMIPGVSRSASTIIGGLTQKLSRKTSAEFSFFLAVPTMFGATLKKCYDYYKDGFVLTHEQINYLVIGNVVAFIVALIAIKTFIGFISKNGFKVFGYYRIIAGITLLILNFFVHSLTII